MDQSGNQSQILAAMPHNLTTSSTSLPNLNWTSLNPTNWNLSSAYPANFNWSSVSPSHWNLSSVCPPNWNCSSISPSNWNLTSICPSDWNCTSAYPQNWNWTALSPTNWDLSALCPSGWNCSVRDLADRVQHFLSQNKGTLWMVLLTFLISLCVRGRCSIIAVILALLDGAKVFFLVFAYTNNFWWGLGGLVICFLIGFVLAALEGKPSTGDKLIYELGGKLRRVTVLSAVPAGAKLLYRSGPAIHRIH